MRDKLFNICEYSCQGVETFWVTVLSKQMKFYQSPKTLIFLKIFLKISIILKWVSISITFFCNFSLMIRREGVASLRKFHTFARFQLDLESSCGAVLRSAHVLSIQHSNIWFGICTINISTVLELLQAWHTA